MQATLSLLEAGVHEREPEQCLADSRRPDEQRRVAARDPAADRGVQPLVAEARAAYQAARALVFEGVAQPNGYTEPLLHHFRARVKSGG